MVLWILYGMFFSWSSKANGKIVTVLAEDVRKQSKGKGPQAVSF